MTPPPRFAQQDPVGHADLFPYFAGEVLLVSPMK